MPWAWRFCCTARCRCDHLPVGVSGQRINIDMAVVVMRMNGTMKDILQAMWAVRPWFCIRESTMAGITK